MTEPKQPAHGLNKCPRCGASEIRYDITHRALVCEFCRHTWNEDNAEATLGFDSAISELDGEQISSGAHDITGDDDTVTIKCQGCGAEVVMATNRTVEARCHWCRQTLTLNTQVPSGAVPDMLLPFSITHQQAAAAANTFAKKRWFFAKPAFKQQFAPQNILGVYMPYVTLDGNVSAALQGTGEHLVRSWTDNDDNTHYTANAFRVVRTFDYTVDDLYLESSSERAKMGAGNTNNVINAILPFDVKNAVLYNSHYLGEFTSERRDVNVEELRPRAGQLFFTVAREHVGPMVDKYDRGVCWEYEDIKVHGTRWVTTYLPVWMYSYRATNGLVHYIAVNGRTGKTMGSIPVNRPLLAAVSFVIFLVTLVTGIGISGVIE